MKPLPRDQVIILILRADGRIDLLSDLPPWLSGFLAQIFHVKRGRLLKQFPSSETCEFLVLKWIQTAFTNLFVGIHRGESTVMARLSTLSSNILDLFVRSVVEITGVGVVNHCDSDICTEQ